MVEANWLQRPGQTMNPFYGTAMQQCGGAVEPLPKAESLAAANGTQSGGGEMLLAIPRSAVIEAGRNGIVYVESSPGVFDMRAVKVGPQAGEFYPVVSGLERAASGS